MSLFDRKNLGFGFMGNGEVVWDRTIKERGDYKKVAHVQGRPNERVAPDDNVTIKLFTDELTPEYTAQLKAYLSTFYSVKKFITDGR